MDHRHRPASSQLSSVHELRRRRSRAASPPGSPRPHRRYLVAIAEEAVLAECRRWEHVDDRCPLPRRSCRRYTSHAVVGRWAAFPPGSRAGRRRSRCHHTRGPLSADAVVHGALTTGVRRLVTAIRRCTPTPSSTTTSASGLAVQEGRIAGLAAVAEEAIVAEAVIDGIARWSPWPRHSCRRCSPNTIVDAWAPCPRWQVQERVAGLYAPSQNSPLSQLPWFTVLTSRRQTPRHTSSSVHETPSSCRPREFPAWQSSTASQVSLPSQKRPLVQSCRRWAR